MTDEKTALEYRQAPIDAQLQRAGYRRTDYADDYDINEAEEEVIQVDWTRWARAIFRRKRLIAAAVVAGTALSLFAAFRTRDTYQAYAVISVGKEDTPVIKFREGDLVIQNDESLKTKMYLLQSNPLIEEVIVNMKLDRSEGILNPGGLTLKEAFGSLSERVKKVFQWERNRLEPAPNIPDSLSTTTSGDATEPRYSPAESWRLAPFVELFRKNLSVEPASDAWLKNFSAGPASDAPLLKIAYTHPDPALAAAICNQLAQTLINRNVENKSGKFKEASNWLDRSTRDLKARAERAEQALANYTRAHTNIAPQGKGSLSADRLLRLQAEVTRAQTDRIVKESLYEDVRQGRVEQVPSAYSDATLAELQKKAGDLMTQAAQLDVNYGPDNPQTVEIQRQIAAIQKQIESRRKSLEAKLKLDFDRAVRDERELTRALEEAKNETAKENVDTFQYGILQQEVDTTKALYKNFLEKSSEANFELAQQQNNLHVVEPARIPRVISGPNRTLWTMVGFAISLTFGVGLALLLEFFDHTIKTTDDLSRRLQLPALAVIPTIGEDAARSLLGKFKDTLKLPAGVTLLKAAANGSAAVNGGADRGLNAIGAVPSGQQFITISDRSPAAEAYRLLRTSIMLSENGEGFKPKTWLFTSGQPAEGKTTTAINVAISIAQLGRSVLIVDCDLRTPTVHKKLQVDRKPGLSTYLSGDVELEDVIQKLDLPCLSLIPSGDVPHNPCDLIGSRKMKEMVKTLADRYDYVMFDSPPLINLADPLILSTIVDSVILIVNGGKSNWESINHARQELSTIGANVFGVVLNDVAINHIPYYRYYT
ncbi:MAG TPA: polysaccharide biosynthesis tyrosine autokinase [Blastocatellia bacterium]|nr:polysaccharide biosynthesis tyrosine autokinase [Blastocatellia bacterium]